MKIIKNFYCNGFFGRRYDLRNAIIIEETENSITIETEDGDECTANFDDEEDKNSYIDEWTSGF